MLGELSGVLRAALLMRDVALMQAVAEGMTVLAARHPSLTLDPADLALIHDLLGPPPRPTEPVVTSD